MHRYRPIGHADPGSRRTAACCVSSVPAGDSARPGPPGLTDSRLRFDEVSVCGVRTAEASSSKRHSSERSCSILPVASATARVRSRAARPALSATANRRTTPTVTTTSSASATTTSTRVKPEDNRGCIDQRPRSSSATGAPIAGRADFPGKLAMEMRDEAECTQKGQRGLRGDRQKTRSPERMRSLGCLDCRYGG